MKHVKTFLPAQFLRLINIAKHLSTYLRYTCSRWKEERMTSILEQRSRSFSCLLPDKLRSRTTRQHGLCDVRFSYLFLLTEVSINFSLLARETFQISLSLSFVYQSSAALQLLTMTLNIYSDMEPR